MIRKIAPFILFLACAGMFARPISAQLEERKALTLEAAKKMVASSEALAMANKWNVSIAVLDVNGDLIAFERLDGSATIAVISCQGKARAALVFGRPTKDLQDAVAGGRAMSAPSGMGEMTFVQGGLPIRADGKIIGAIGVGGAASAQDEQVAKAGLDALGISQQ
jgi:glc operon protein GlcG